MAIQEWASLKVDLEVYDVVLDSALARQELSESLETLFYDKGVNGLHHSRGGLVKSATKKNVRCLIYLYMGARNSSFSKITSEPMDS